MFRPDFFTLPAAGKLRGEGREIYVGEFEHAPDPRLWDDEWALITSHTSGKSDDPRHRAVDLFCDKLQAHLAGRPPANAIDWGRGY